MRDSYDFSKSIPNPYAKTQVTIGIDHKTIDYFKTLAQKKGMSYQNVINLYLTDCAQQHKQI